VSSASVSTSPAAASTPAVPSRRERLRAQTVQEIKTVAREHLAAHGPTGVQLRAVARDVGMTAPALYRYFDSHEALLAALVGDLYGELADVIEAATAPSNGDLTARLAGSARAFRSWSIQHPAEFTLLFGSPIPGVDVAEDGPEHQQARRFGQAFGALFAEMWETQPFPVPETIDPEMRATLERYRDHVGVTLPAEAIAVFLSCWVRLYGAVTMEVFGHVSFAMSDAAPLFEAELRGLTDRLGLTHSAMPA
jgi:AcrR family transcriptional regulator